MGKFIKNNKLLIAVTFIFMAVVGVGVYFSLKKAEPVYINKIDKIMFDTKNKAPKHVITLPDKEKRVVEKIEPKKKNEKLAEVVKKTTLEEVVRGIPMLNQITPMAGKSPLKHVANYSGMIETIDGLEVPKISSNGKRPWTEYGNRVNVLPNFYKVAVVIKNMGMDTALTELLIKGSPPNISYSFSPYGRNLKDLIKEAREYGHETYADIILDSPNYMQKDAGPMAMNVNASDDEIIKRIKKIISPGMPVGGVVVGRGQTRNRENVERSLNFVKDRGILMVDATESDFLESIEVEGLARKKADVIIDSVFNKAYIKEQLKTAEEIAIQNGQVLIVIDAKPSVLLLVKEWVDNFSPQYTYEEAKDLGIDMRLIEKPFAIVPVSALVVE
ncbi:MAG: divergent polysaccharide deacetylase family protein [Lactobacillus sp.]|nr:divergent polysaccharide deacetylase family protein [Lactobacillus sp.]